MPINDKLGDVKNKASLLDTKFEDKDTKKANKHAKKLSTQIFSQISSINKYVNPPNSKLITELEKDA